MVVSWPAHNYSDRQSVIAALVTLGLLRNICRVKQHRSDHGWSIDLVMLQKMSYSSPPANFYKKKTLLVHSLVNPTHLAYSYLINKASSELSYPTIRTSGRCPPILVTVTTSGCPMPNAQRSYYLKRVFPIMRNCSSALRDMIIWFNSKPSQVSFA